MDFDYKVELAALLEREDNKLCADCKGPERQWASVNIGCFLCIKCSGVHRGLGTSVSKVKSTGLDSWNEEQIETMKNAGNVAVNNLYEARIPDGYPMPDPEVDPLPFLVGFIRSKYVDKTWIDPESEGLQDCPTKEDLAYNLTHKEGYLTIKSKGVKNKKRWATLDKLNLAFFSSKEDTQPEIMLNLNHCTMDVQDDVEAKLNRFTLISSLKDANAKIIRHFVVADSAEILISWVNSINYAQRVYGTQETTSEPVKSGFASVEREGYMVKQGGRVKNWKRRLFILYDKYLCYYKSTKDLHPTGTIFIDEVDVEACAPTYRSGNCFAVVTTSRKYIIDCSSEEERDEWMEAIIKRRDEYRDSRTQQTGDASNNGESKEEISTDSQ